MEKCYQSCCARGLFSIAAYEHLTMILYVSVATHGYSPSINNMRVRGLRADKNSVKETLTLNPNFKGLYLTCG
jgi:hypothetical protein